MSYLQNVFLARWLFSIKGPSGWIESEKNSLLEEIRSLKTPRRTRQT